jgi:pyruvate dehydrogenase E1 component alpha subunit
MNVLTVHQTAKEWIDRTRDGNGPCILEMMTYRYRGHSMSDPAKYRPKEEVDKVRSESDPIDMLRNHLIEAGYLTEKDIKAIEREIRNIVVGAAEFAQEAKEPDSSELWTDVLLTDNDDQE